MATNDNMSASQVGRDPQDPASQMAWLEQAIQEVDDLWKTHNSRDDGLDVILDAQLTTAERLFREELDEYQEAYPNVTPDHDAVQPNVRTGNLVDRSGEINVDSNESLRVDFSIALLRFALRNYRQYHGPEVITAKFEQQIVSDKKELVRQLESAKSRDTSGIDATQNADEAGEAWDNSSDDILSDTQDSASYLSPRPKWKDFEDTFSDAYDQRRTLEFHHQVLTKSTHNSMDGRKEGPIDHKHFFQTISCLCNHDFNKIWALQGVSVHTGRLNIINGARQWLDDLHGPGLQYHLALPDVDAREYWYHFWQDVDFDHTLATYERLYIGVRHISVSFTTITPSIVGYVRSIMEILTYGDVLSEDQALVLGRLIQLRGLIDCNDDDNEKVKGDTLNAVSRIKTACNTSSFALMEYMTTMREREQFDKIPRPLSRHFEDPPSMMFEPKTYHFFTLQHQGVALIMFKELLSPKRWIVPVDQLTLVYESGDGKIDQFWFEIRGESVYMDPKFEETKFKPFQSTVEALRAMFPGVETRQM